MKGEAIGSLSKRIIGLGVIVMMIGVAFISWLSANKSFVSEILSISLLWMVVVLLIIVTASLDEMNSELKEVYSKQTEEIKLLRAESSLLRYDIISIINRNKPKEKK
ncbi:MAG: hypothetical protein NTV63_02145 [Candidatus Woesearchaeota archaeon]|nr:hypothetical protein [Candidatus Woesearchaeota archaeon]